jgi:hypothetical protein
VPIAYGIISAPRRANVIVAHRWHRRTTEKSGKLIQTSPLPDIGYQSILIDAYLGNRHDDSMWSRFREVMTRQRKEPWPLLLISGLLEGLIAIALLWYAAFDSGHPVYILVLAVACITIASLFVILLVYLRRLKQTALREHTGLCLHCGYDLRASPDRCPECGTYAWNKIEDVPFTVEKREPHDPAPSVDSN